MKNIAVLVSGGGTNLQALIDAQARREINGGEIGMVVSSNPEAYALERAKQANIPGYVLPRKNWPSNQAYTKALVRLLQEMGADIVVLVIDAVEGVSEQDAKIAGIAHDRGKAMIIAVNKWDAVEKDNKTVNEFTQKVRQVLSFMPYAEIIYISAVTGQRLGKLFDLIDAVSENHSMRVATGVLNEIMAEAVTLQQPPSDKGRRLRLYYITQVSVKPPTFVIFVNDKELMHFSYTRYLENQIRETFGFLGTPLRFIIRERKENR